MKTQLDKLATDIVGDGKSPNLYFVSHNGTVIMVGRSFIAAHAAWSALPRDCSTCLEDRQTGVIASTERRTDDDGEELAGWATYDDSHTFRKHRPTLATQ